MKVSHGIASLALAAALAAPSVSFAGQSDEGPWAGDRFIATDALRADTLRITQSSTNKAAGNTLIVVGAVILLGGLGSGSGAGQVLVLGAGGFLIGLGYDGRPTTDPWRTRLSLGYWRGEPTASYTLFRF